MSNFSALKTAIQNAIKQNGNEEITGNLLQNILISVVETLGDSAINTLETGLSNEASTRGNTDTTLQTNINNEATARQNIDTQLQNAINEINTYLAKGYVFAGVATPAGTPVSGRVFYVATTAGRYTYFGNLQVQNGISILLVENDSWTLHQLLVVDLSLVQNSKNPVSGGAVYQAIQHEETERHAADTRLQNNINNENIRAVGVENSLHLEIVEETDKRKQEIQGMRDDVLDLIHEYRPIEISGNVVNAPDEEDITQQPNNLLKFKDKDYNPTIFSGLGRKYLRKNIIINEDYTSFDGFEMNPEADAMLEGQPDSILWDRLRERFIAEKDDVYYLDWQGSGDYIPVNADKIYVNENIPYFWNGEDLAVDDDVIARYGNILTQEMMSDANTIYVIQYDFTLGENIIVPTNCVLEFDGGSIINTKSNTYTIVLQNTLIGGNVNFDNIIFSGTCKNQTIYQSWFKNNDIDDFFKFINTVLPIGDTIVYSFEGGTYYPTVLVHKSSNKNIIVEGNGAKIVYSQDTVIEGQYVFMFNYTQSDTTKHYLRTIATPESGRIELDNITGLNIGNYITIRDSATSSFSYYRDYQQGEIVKIRGFSNNAENAIVPDEYLKGNYKHVENNESYVIKTDFGNLSISDISFVLDESLSAEIDSKALLFEHYRLSIKNVVVQSFRYCLVIQYCLDSQINNCVINANPKYADNIDNYGLQINNSQNINVIGGDYRGGNHGIAIGGHATGNYSIVNRFIHISGVKAYSYKFRIGIDAHGDTEYCTFINNMTDGIKPCANKGTVIGNIVDGNIAQSEVLGLSHIISNNILTGSISLNVSHTKRDDASYDNYTVPTNNEVLIANNKANLCVVKVEQKKSVSPVNFIDSCCVKVDGNIITSTQQYILKLYDANDDIIEDADYSVELSNNKFGNINYNQSDVPILKYFNNIGGYAWRISAKKIYISDNKVYYKSAAYVFEMMPVGENLSGLYTLVEGYIENNYTEQNFLNIGNIDSNGSFNLYCKGNTVRNDARFFGSTSVADPTSVSYHIYWDDNDVVDGRYASSPGTPAKSIVLRKYTDNNSNQYTYATNNPLGLILYKALNVNNPLAYTNSIGENIPMTPMHGVELASGHNCFAVPFTIISGNYLDCIVAIRDGSKAALLHISSYGGGARCNIISNRGFTTITYPISFMRDNTNGVYYIKFDNLTTGYPHISLYVTTTVNSDNRFVESVDSTELDSFNGVDIYGYDGAIYDVPRSGTMAERPNDGKKIYVGFQYMQVDGVNGTKPIWASAINGSTITWIDATGTQV